MASISFELAVFVSSGGLSADLLLIYRAGRQISLYFY